PVHFGLGDYDSADRVVVRWPSGIIQYHADIPADRTVTFIEGQGASCGDVDGDGRVDLVDFATFALCFRGDGNTTRPAACTDEAWLSSDCDGDGDVDLRDFATLAANFNGSSGLLDCNGNAIPDECDLSCGPAAGPCDLPGCGQSEDCNANAIPDECEPAEDCNGNDVQDICDIAAGTSADDDGDDVPDECEAPLRFVRADAQAGGVGLTWATAFNDLQDALDAAAEYSSPVTEIWVAAGTYTPDRGTGNRNARFQLLDGVTIYGGFAGDEDPETFDLDERDFEVNETILSGDLAGNDEPDFTNIQENSRHVVDASGTGATTILDGFTITAGYADGAGNPIYDDSGAGMFNRLGDPTIRNCTFAANFAQGYGGGMMNHDRCDSTLINCSFIGNVAQEGGAMRNWMSTITMVDCAFQSNTAQDGGAIYNLRTNDVTLTRCSFIQNSAGGQGGALHNDYDNTLEMTHCTSGQNLAEEGAALFGTRYNHLTIHNCCFHENDATSIGGAIYLFMDNTASLSHCTFADNVAANGRAMATDTYAGQASSQVELTNCILWNGGGEVWNHDDSTVDIAYSDLWDSLPGQGNIYADPLFVDGPAGSYYLSQTAAGQPQNSPCANAGFGIPVEWGLEQHTTRTDQEVDRQIADMGFHYPVVEQDSDPPPEDGDPAEDIDH
ncbi:MAG: ASPIC/UnbV domain-containing protein, partial [Phycisphaerales bacterium]